MMNRYEMIYIIDADLEEAARKELIEKVSALITNNGGEIEKVDETWGKRRLPRELERNLQINENVLRYLVIKLVEKRSSVKPRAERPAPVAAPVDEAPVAEEAAPAVAAEEAPAADAE